MVPMIQNLSTRGDGGCLFQQRPSTRCEPISSILQQLFTAGHPFSTQNNASIQSQQPSFQEFTVYDNDLQNIPPPPSPSYFQPEKPLRPRQYSGATATIQEIEKILHHNAAQATAATAATPDDDDEDEEEDEGADFHPPRQAMNSEESDFDWYEDINIDGAGDRKAQKQRSTWKKLAPFLRMVLLIVIVATHLDPPRGVGRALDTFDGEVVYCLHQQLGRRYHPHGRGSNYTKWVLATIWGLCVFVVPSHVIRPVIADVGWHRIVNKVLGGLIAGALLILLEKILLNKISEGFHRTAYAGRIKVNKYALSVVNQLGISRKIFKRIRPSVGNAFMSMSGGRSTPVPFENVEVVGHDLTPGSDVSDPHPHEPWACPRAQHRPKSDPSRVPDCTSRRGSKNDLLDSADMMGGGLASSEKPRDYATIAVTPSATKRTQRERGANEELVVTDFYPYFDTEDEAKATFAMFNKDSNGDISKKETKEKIFYIYKECKNLHTALRDLSQAVGKLDMIFLSVAFVI
ncbi:hypothetical protein BGX29_007716 [Mortierella sp. GBA35]|nr:hypothetical protein BGX29_007716 [Mortierella sp. GBA35]